MATFVVYFAIANYHAYGYFSYFWTFVGMTFLNTVSENGIT